MAAKLSTVERAAFARRAALCQESADRTPSDCWRQLVWHESAAKRWARAASWASVARWDAEEQRSALELAAEANGDAPAVLDLAVQLLRAGTPVGACLPCARAIAEPTGAR
jgi:hypothetical protein